MITTIILIGLVLSALGFAVYLGRQLARYRALYESEKTRAEVRRRLITTLLGSLESEAEFRKLIKVISNAADIAELNRLYKEILSNN